MTFIDSYLLIHKLRMHNDKICAANAAKNIQTLAKNIWEGQVWVKSSLCFRIHVQIQSLSTGLKLNTLFAKNNQSHNSTFPKGKNIFGSSQNSSSLGQATYQFLLRQYCIYFNLVPSATAASYSV